MKHLQCYVCQLSSVEVLSSYAVVTFDQQYLDGAELSHQDGGHTYVPISLKLLFSKH